MRDVTPEVKKLCVNCAHYVKLPASYSPNLNPPHECHARSWQDQITGVYNFPSCRSMRSVKGDCGPEAKLFMINRLPDPYEAQAYLPPRGIVARLRAFFRPYG